jgi:excisionase family DNA binding protein
MQMEGKHRLLSLPKAAAYLGIAHSTLYKWVSHKRIPVFRSGRLLKFDINELDKIIEKTKVDPIKVAYEH